MNCWPIWHRYSDHPVAVAELAEGEVVLDLGSGGGIDVLLSARRVGPTGKAYGIDMTDEMLEVARAHQVEAGLTGRRVSQGPPRAIPLPDASVDVVLSNCVIALTLDKHRVLGEAMRVLRPGGRLAIADVAADADRPSEQTIDPTSWLDCVSGALTQSEYVAALEQAGFADISIEPSHQVLDGLTSIIVRASRSPSR
ncbi:MAG: methyltransferase domain-containing protein [Acidimicrobiales bacterium]